MFNKIIALLTSLLVCGSAGALVQNSVPSSPTSGETTSVVSCAQPSASSADSVVSAGTASSEKAAAAVSSAVPSSTVSSATKASSSCAANGTGNAYCLQNRTCDQKASCSQNSCNSGSQTCTGNNNCLQIQSGSNCTGGQSCQDSLNKLLASLKNRYGQSSSNQTASSSAPSSAPSSSSKPSASSSSGSTTAASGYSDFQNQVVQLVNQERTSRGLQALSIDSALTKTATLKSQDMANLNYFDHTSPTYGSPFDMMKQFGISYHAAGENIAMGQTSPQQVMQGWMNSEGHRANILNSSFTKIGVGIAKNSSGRLYWTQQFIG